MKVDKEVRKRLEGDDWNPVEIYVSDHGNAHITFGGRFLKIGDRTALAKIFLEFDKLFKEYECNVKKELAFKNIRVDCD